MNSRLLSVLILAAASLSAAEPPALSDEDQRAVLKQLVAISQGQLAVYQADEQAKKRQQDLMQSLQQMSAKFQQTQEALRKKMGVAAECNLNVEAAWVCPPAKEDNAKR
jgi:DNA polymerase III alpha subunit